MAEFIGKVNRDLGASERKYDAAYPGLDTATGVKALLRDYTKLRRNAFDVGDYDALVLALDFEAAVALAQLTDRQAEVLALVYCDGLTQQEAADALGIEQQAVSERITAGARRIAAVYAEWERVNDET